MSEIPQNISTAITNMPTSIPTSMPEISTDVYPDTSVGETNIFDSIKESVSEVMPKKVTPVVLFSLVVGLLTGVFIFLLNHKYTYELSNYLLKDAFGETWDKKYKCPTTRGLWVHSFIGGIVAFFFIFLSRKPLIKLMKKHLNI